MTEEQAYQEYVARCHSEMGVFVSEFNFNEWRAMGRPKSHKPKDGSWPTPWGERMIYTIKASTPEAMRDEIVKWLKMNASNHRIKAGNAVLVGTRKEQTTMGIAYQQAAEFIEKLNIEV